MDTKIEYTINFLYYTYILVLSLCICIGLWRVKTLDSKSNFVLWIMVFALTTEMLCKAASLHGKIRTPIYHIYCLIDFFLVTLYFLKTINFKETRSTLFICALGIYITGVLNFIFLQSINVTNTYMQIFESFVLIIFSLYSLYKILINDDIKNIIYYPHLWFWSSFLLLYSGTLFFWICINLLSHDKSTLETTELIQEIVNIIAYAGIGLTFYFYPKMVKSEQ